MTADGTIYLVGAGPGDGGLMTLRGKDLLGRADVVVYDYLAAPALLALAPPSAQRIYVGKQAGQHTLTQDKINQLLVDLAKQGKTVVRLKGGDPYVFGRGGEEALAAVEAGLRFEVVPGVTSGIAALAYAGIPATHRGLASCLGLITGHESDQKDDSALDYAALARWGGTLVFYMGISNLPTICRRLIEHGMAASTPAGVVRWGSTARQQVVAGTLDDLAQRVQQAGLKPPALIVVGQVVSLRDKLNWFENRPLFGRRIIVTRSRAQASDLSASLTQLGAEVIELPAIRIEPAADLKALDAAAGKAGQFDWIIFTSVNGVDAFFGSLRAAGLDSRSLGRAKVAAIGPATADRLGQVGIVADLQPEKFLSTAIVAALAAADHLPGKKILCPRADIAPKELIVALEKLGASVTDVAAYRTVAEEELPADAAAWMDEGPVDWVTFTSSSTAENFFRLVDRAALGDCRIASIGPTTSVTIRHLGTEVTAEASSHTIDGLVQTIVDFERAAQARK